MSATEVIEQLKNLPPEEQEKVVEYVHAAENAGAFGKGRSAVSDGFKRVADEVFTTNAELFRQLAQ
jgi:hypothetical protein